MRATSRRAAWSMPAGPWVDRGAGRSVAGQNTPAKVRLVKGSHIVTRRLYDHDRCYIFQNADGRICFAIPYEDDFTLIGTTDEDFTGDPADAAISEAETDYLCRAVSDYFAPAGHPGRCGLELCGRAAALRRWRQPAPRKRRGTMS